MLGTMAVTLMNAQVLRCIMETKVVFKVQTPYKLNCMVSIISPPLQHYKKLIAILSIYTTYVTN